MFVTLIDSSHRDKPQVRATCSEVISSRDGLVLLDCMAIRRDVLASHSVPSCHDLINLITYRQTEVRLSHDWTVKVYD